MPLRDGTGPNGEGPRTGRGLGNCPVDISDKDIGVLRRDRAMRLGRGRGLGLGLGICRNVNFIPMIDTQKTHGAR